MDLLQEIKAILDGLIPDDIYLPGKADFTDSEFEDIVWSILDVVKIINREIDKKEKQFLMS